MRFARFLSFLSAVAVLACSACCGSPSAKIACKLERNDWAPDVKANVNEFVSLYHNTPNGYAVFDFDNTSSIFDVSEQLMAYQLETMSFALTPGNFVSSLFPELEEAPEEAYDWARDISGAYNYLYDRYGPFSAAGLDGSAQERIRKDPCWLDFASKMGAMYWRIADWVSVEASYRWILYWHSGMTEREVYDLAVRSHLKYGKVKTSTVRWEGSPEVNSLVGPVAYEWISGIQVTDNIRELWRLLKDNGIDVWVCSASGIQQILAAVDVFGLHDYCTGVLGMTLKQDSTGRYVSGYDYENGCGRRAVDGGWQTDVLPTRAMTAGPGKVTAICNAIAPSYAGRGPLAGFMDSTGDFNFCTEFESLKMVICFNRADRKITDGGGVIAEVALYEKESLGYTVSTANSAGDTMYLLQGRDENGYRTFRPSNATIRFGNSEERLLADEDNLAQLEQMKAQRMSVADAINTFSASFLSAYPGYHHLKMR